MDDLPDTGFALVRCADRAVIAYFESFPECSRALMYRKGDMVSFMPLQPDEIVGTLSLFTQMLKKAGYRFCESSCSGQLKPDTFFSVNRS